jgi:hypothetical protein
MMKIKLLPLDERPCNLVFPEKICGFSNKLDLIVPSIDILGLKKDAGELEKIDDYLFCDDGCDYLIISLDMFLYGGLVPSRIHNYTFEELENRLAKLRNIKDNYGVSHIYAFSTIMRTPKYNSCDEEPDYYEDYGLDIFNYKYFTDKKDIVGLTDDEQKVLDDIDIPNEFLTDYNNRRMINRQINLEVVKLLELGIFDYLIFPQDDSAEYGYTRIDQEVIYNCLNNLDGSKFSVHPGADEVAMTLIGKIYNQNYNKNRTIKVHFSNEEAKEWIPKYEDRSLIKTLKLHLNCMDFDIVDDDESEFNLYYNCSESEVMIESFNQDYSIEKSIDSKYILENKDLYIIDNCYSNGGDFAFFNAMYSNGFVDNIKGYAAWNTHANSLGTILCQIALDDDVDVVKRDQFVRERIYEDLFYQGYIRKYISENFLSKYNLNYFDLKNKQAIVIEEELKVFKELAGRYDLLVDGKLKITHPWNRMFEIDLNISEEK